jgi:hypothetical protein
MTSPFSSETSSPYAALPPALDTTTRSTEPKLTLERRLDGRLWALLAERAAPVKLRRCFPWTFPERYISLQTEENDELALVSNPEELDAASRAALTQALAEAGFVFLIQRVYSVREDFELRCFDVETPQGRRAFQTALDAWPRETSDGGLLIQDVAGDVFRIEDPETLDAKSRELVWELVD